MVEFKLPELGEDIEEAEVLKVLVKKGDSVEKDQPVLELETDKATFEVPSTLAGTVSELHVNAGDTLKVGDTVLTLEEGAGAPEEKEADEKEAEGRAKPRKEEKDEGEKEQERKAGKKEKAAAGQAADEREEKPKEERAAAETEGGERGERADRDEGETEEPAEVAEDREETREGEDRPGREPGGPPEKAAGESAPVAAGPATRRLARELGVDLRGLEGGGPGGRVTPEDVKAAVRGGRAGTGGPRAGEARDERRPLTGLEKAAIRQLSASWSGIPHVTHHDGADVTELERARERYERRRERSEAKLTMTALVIKACVAALKAFPRVNASLDLEAEELVLKRRYHIGVAVDTEHGLLVPVLRDADGRTTREIAAAVAELAERARERKLSREEMRGATFTVTNLGGIGGTAFTPIVSQPEVAILGVSRTREEPALRAGQVVKRLVLPLSLSYDHRVINGADAARFVRHVAGLLEEPLHLLVES